MDTSKVKYITNKELLLEIHNSKMTYCWVEGELDKYKKHHIIVSDLNNITEEMKEQVINKYNSKAEIKISKEDLVYRLMTDSHIPNDPDGKLRKKGDTMVSSIRTNFPPFKHFILKDDEYVEVARSHWVGSLSNGEFCSDNGKITRRLAYMIMLLSERYAKRGNWRSYSYNDEMRGGAILQLSQVALQFDESKSDNPFAFYTQIIKNSFRRTLNLEKRNQDIRDDLLMASGATPSYTRQLENDIEQGNVSGAEKTEEPAEKKKRGRKKST